MSYPAPSGRFSIGDKHLVGREGKPFLPHPGLLHAANAALAVQRPLLLTGEAGCGKTDFAFAAAHALAAEYGDRVHPHCKELLACYVRSDTRARDLLYRYDAVRRFGDAQHGTDEQRQASRDAREYVELEPLGLALLAPRLRVVLIDEVDKADRDLPNDLLRELDQGCFAIPELPRFTGDGAVPPVSQPVPQIEDRRTWFRQMRRAAGTRRPFVIITSNVERQLPDAFLRRCVFYHIPFPDEDKLEEILLARFNGEDGWPRVDPKMLETALRIFWKLRTKDALQKPPATAECIDWLGVLLTAVPEAERNRGLARIDKGLKRGSLGIDALPWKDLPGLCCLVKLREDLDRLGIREGVAG